MIRRVPGEQQISISMIWPDVADLPVMRANQFIGQHHGGAGAPAPEEFVITGGYLAPPVILGTPEEQQLSLSALGAVPVTALFRVSMSRNSVMMLIKLLQDQVKKYDAAGGVK